MRKELKESTNDDLDELWSEIRRSNSEALSNLFCLSYSWLFDYGYKIVPREEFVKDAIQVLFMNLWRKRNSINKANAIKPYLFSSLRRLIFRRLTKQNNRKERNHAYRLNSFEKLYNVEELIIHFETRNDRHNMLRTAIGCLSERQKEAVYLKFYSGLSNAEISDVMEINKQSVYNHVSKAIKKMQQFVEA